MNFATMKGWEIPEGKSVKVTDASGRALWKAIPATAIVTMEGDLDEIFAIGYSSPADGSIVRMDKVGTYELPTGTILKFGIIPQPEYWGSICLNDEYVAEGGEDGEIVEYEYTLKGNITILCAHEVPDEIIYITET